ncbi:MULTISPECIES: thiamine pyrophosphate-dependent dehydrogenase E1 component subunit alpha [unclassified Polynucleobacter]|uniref:thiamine pyrophosphate-dependent dehydrogenase E1 component subunit alpha n=1 Tax=unclassified Polynucleobacter TaxID=2640945 RepID=UPI0008AEDA5D|nr:MULTISPECIES: thiamine pyrophosphate-dependent dehydrogenase E1 component subunit alpha [unclassified Polynucleobacter]OHC09842.1 MAG: acetoin dehydrogenase [Polynucleobacter sp. GWA2_45_21]HBK42804.1 acetoin dehydrogenase [Polynucleobacter sp.]
MDIDNNFRLKLFANILRIRAVELTIASCYSEQQMRCPVHLVIGQEASEVGACAALNKTDYAFSGHRSHGHYLAKGGNLNAMMAEIYGKSGGCANGRGGSMHLIDLEAGFLGAVPIVGSTIPIATGVAMASKLKKDNKVVMVFLGDGATETGAFYESLNYSSLKDLPIVFIVENNAYSVYSPLDVRQKSESRIVDIAKSHAMPAKKIDGNNVELVYEASKAAVDRARSGVGPSLLELTTYRWLEHCGPNYDNDIGYRSESEFLVWKEKDPISLYQKFLLSQGVLTEEMLGELTDKSYKEAEDAINFAKNSPWPQVVDFSAEVYSQ